METTTLEKRKTASKHETQIMEDLRQFKSSLYFKKSGMDLTQETGTPKVYAISDYR